MSRALDISIGTRFGRLTILRPAGSSDGRRLWECACDCKAVVIKAASLLVRSPGGIRSCGCLRRESSVAQRAAATTHGLSALPLYGVWSSIRNRCYNPKCREYKYYGGRGITMCARWLESPQYFIDDVGERPSPDHQIDRRDNNGPYSPENCRWATPKEQCNNRRSNVLITYNGKTQNCAQWGAELGIDPSNIRQRLRVYKMPPERALSTVSLLNSGRRGEQ